MMNAYDELMPMMMKMMTMMMRMVTMMMMASAGDADENDGQMSMPRNENTNSA